MNQGRILIVEDEPRWQDTLQIFLKKEGYFVDIASNYEEALQKLQSKWFHLVVVDICLTNSNIENEEGLLILDKMSELGLDDVTQKIVVTAHPTLARQRTAFKKYGILDFVPKMGTEANQGFDNLEFIRLVEQVFSTNNINLNLEIHVSDNVQLTEIASRLLEDYPLELRESELRDLFNRLFFDKSSIVISSLSSGHSSSVLLEIESYCINRGRFQPVIVKIDKHDRIQRESDNFQHYISGFIGGFRHTNLDRAKFTNHLGAIVYSLLGYTGKFKLFSEFYLSSDAAKVVFTLNNLFDETCRRWYENRTPKHSVNLSKNYRDQLGFNSAKLKKAFHDCFGENDDSNILKFQGIEETFPNPLSCQYIEEKSFLLPVLNSITHGDLNSTNILVDSNGYTWLIDFYKTGEGHIFRDFIELEVSIKFELICVDNLLALYELERTLLSGNDFSEILEFPNSYKNEELQKAFRAIVALRLLAQKIAMPNTEMTDYYIGLFYQTTNLLRYYWVVKQPPKSRRQYALLSAAMLTKRITQMNSNDRGVR